MPSSEPSQQENIENPEETVLSTIKKGLEVEAIEVRVARGVFEEELADAFENPELTFILDKDPVRIFNKGYHDDTLAYEDKDFDLDLDGVEVVGVDNENINTKEARSLYERHELKEPRTGKVFRVDQMIYNNAYFPFNTLNAATIGEQRQKEMSIIPDFVDSNYGSAFDKKVIGVAKKEVLSISFDGYIFAFSRFVYSNGGEHVELEIEQYKKEDSEGRKCIRRSNIIEGFGIKEFSELKTSVQGKIETAKPQVTNQ